MELFKFFLFFKIQNFKKNSKFKKRKMFTLYHFRKIFKVLDYDIFKLGNIDLNLKKFVNRKLFIKNYFRYLWFRDMYKHYESVLPKYKEYVEYLREYKKKFIKTKAELYWFIEYKEAQTAKHITHQKHWRCFKKWKKRYKRNIPFNLIKLGVNLEKKFKKSFVNKFLKKKKNYFIRTKKFQNKRKINKYRFFSMFKDIYFVNFSNRSFSKYLYYFKGLYYKKLESDKALLCFGRYDYYYIFNLYVNNKLVVSTSTFKFRDIQEEPFRTKMYRVGISIIATLKKYKKIDQLDFIYLQKKYEITDFYVKRKNSLESKYMLRFLNPLKNYLKQNKIKVKKKAHCVTSYANKTNKLKKKRRK